MIALELSTHLWWFLSRATGIIAWLALTSSCALGILLATRILKPYDRPAWLLGLHRYLAALFFVLTAVHLGALTLDSYAPFSLADLFLPLASRWKPVPVALGIVALYVAVLVEVSSLFMRKLSKHLWHALHVTSYISLVLVSVHAFMAGSDAGSTLFLSGSAAALAAFSLFVLVRLLYQRGPSQRVQVSRRSIPEQSAGIEPVSQPGTYL